MAASNVVDDSNDWKRVFSAELEHAERARQAGNEGMARVCARRAAGAAAGAYLKQRGYTGIGPSAYDSLRYLISLAETDPLVRATASHFILRITPEHDLPVQADLIADARWLEKNLFEKS